MSTTRLHNYKAGHPTKSISIYQSGIVICAQKTWVFPFVPDGVSVCALIKDCTMPFPNIPSHFAPNPAAVMYLVA